MRYLALFYLLRLAGASHSYSGASHARRQINTLSWPSASDWQALNQQVGGRLFPNAPFAQPCFDEGFDSAACEKIKENYGDEVYRAGTPNGYIQTQWETCQNEIGEQCLLDYLEPGNPAPTLFPNTCRAGSVPSYMIDVRTAGDVATAFNFSRRTKVPITIKNTGHDYKGRSSAPNTLGLWTHNLKDISLNTTFVPEGCSASTNFSAVTMGAGIQWFEAYEFAEAKSITLVGGADRSVGSAGGWLQGGGHGALSNTMGLGVDRVLQYKVVTPDGTLRTANACQNQDLFFALRGGGGGTFGVVLEATTLASPRVNVQVIIFSFGKINLPANSTTSFSDLTKELWTILAVNGLRWAEEGWGGYVTPGTAVFVNPGEAFHGKPDQVKASMQDLLNFAAKVKQLDLDNGNDGSTLPLIVTELPSWYSFFNVFASQFVAAVGRNLAMASRLIPKSSLATNESQTDLVNGLLAAAELTPNLIILVTAPSTFTPFPYSNFGYGDAFGTSVTPAWRNSLYHVTVVSTWNWNATIQDKMDQYSKVDESIENLRRITDDAAYVNESDVHEPNWQASFWGSNYDQLLAIKQKYDPDQLLDCWHCVGWKSDSPLFSCYL